MSLAVRVSDDSDYRGGDCGHQPGRPTEVTHRSIGMTSLLVAVGLFSETLALLPRPGAWMVWIKRATAVIMIGVAQYYFVKAGYNL